MKPVDPVVPDGWHELVFAKDQPQYRPLPAVRDSDGTVTTEWEPSRDELVRLILSGRVRLTQHTFNRPPQARPARGYRLNCQACRGACCESFILPRMDVSPPDDDARRWLELHATVSRGSMEFECRCTALTPEGRCGIYENRPTVCRVYQPGGADCLNTVRRRRTPEQYAEIREAGDPERIHPPAALVAAFGLAGSPGATPFTPGNPFEMDHDDTVTADWGGE